MLVRKSSLEAVDFRGLRIFDYTAAYDLASSLAQIEVPAGTGHAEAWSERSDKFYLVTEGIVSFRLRDEVFALSQGDFCHVGVGEHFSYRNDTDEPANLVLVHTPSFELESEKFAE